MASHRILCAFTTAFLIFTGGGDAGANPSRSLSVYTWSEYIDPRLVAEFEAEFDVKVEFSFFDSDEQRDKELTASNGAGFDVVVVNGVQMSQYVKRGWIEPLNGSKAPNIRHIDSQWSSALGNAADGYGAAYFWGTLGIAWRSDLYPEGFSSWQDLLEPDAKLHGRILMTSYGRELIGFALKADGYSINTTDRSLIRKAGRKLLLQKPFVRGYGYPALTEESSLITGDVWVAPMYSGDALALQALDDRIEYRLPDEGGQLWVDYLTVAEESKNKTIATAFIDFLNRPDVAARNAEYVFFATPNIAARALMSAEYLADPVIHPSRTQLRNSEFLRPLPARITKSVNTMVSELHAD